MKKLLSIAVASVLALSMFAGCGKGSTSSSKGDYSDGGKVLNIYVWNTEFKDRFTNYFEKAGKVPSGVKVNFIQTPSDNNAYQNKLDTALKAQKTAAADDKIDIFLIEADYAMKYTKTDYSLDIKGDVGLTDSDLSNQYKYTQQIVSDNNGKLKATSWQATPGVFAYRRSIAKAVLGTDDPAKVQEAISDWSKFDATAEKAAAKGYKMLSGYDDSYRTFSNNMSAPWVDKNNTIQIDANIMKWIDQTKTYTDKGYNNKTTLWAPEWSKDQGPTGKVFGFFYSTWGINFTLLGNSLATATKDGGKEEVGNGIYGDYAVCAGPQAYYWGGTWLCAAAGTDNISLVKDIMKTLTCDSATMKKITQDTQDYTNNKAAMTEIANSDYKSAFLGGQNHIKDFAAAADKIEMKNLTNYDQGCNESIQKAFHDYFNGKVDKNTATATFYKDVIEKYPNLKKPS